MLRRSTRAPRKAFDWGEAVLPRHAHDTIVYELHVKGFTARANSGVAEERRGTFLGLIDKIPYLKDLGVTVVELLPVQQFDPQEGNYWGYMTLNFFAPHQRLRRARTCARIPGNGARVSRRRGSRCGWMSFIITLRKGDQNGPTYSMRGVDNASYYLVQRRHYRNDSGCGNTTVARIPSRGRWCLRSLRYWAEQMRVDGFRFDLASVFARDIHGNVDTSLPALVHEIGALAAQLDVRASRRGLGHRRLLARARFPRLGLAPVERAVPG